MTDDFCAKFVYENMAPCVFRKSRVVDIFERDGRTHVVYDNGRTMILRADVYEVRQEVFGDDPE